MCHDGLEHGCGQREPAGAVRAVLGELREVAGGGPVAGPGRRPGAGGAHSLGLQLQWLDRGAREAARGAAGESSSILTLLMYIGIHNIRRWHLLSMKIFADKRSNFRWKDHALVGTFNKEKAQVEAFSDYC